MTNPTELLPCIYVRFADNGEIRKWDRKPFDGATEYHAAVSGLLPMATAPKDRTVILGVMRDDLPETDGGFSPHRWSGRIVPIRHEGKTVSGYDLGWSVALPVGHGGLPDDWFVGWVPVATALSSAPAPVASGEVERLADKETTLILRALRTRMATACDWTKAGKDHVKVRTADWHVLMELGERAKASLTTPARAVSREEVAKLFFEWGPGRGTECGFADAPTSIRDRCNHFSDAIIALIGGE